MKIGIRKFFRRNWKKCMCGITMFMGVLAVSFTALKPKAMEISTENYLSDGEQDFTICNLLLTENVDTLGFYTDADLHVEFYTSNTSQFVDYIYLADYYVNNSTYVIKKFNINININPSNYLYLTFYFFSDEMEIDYETNCLVYTNVDYYIVQSFDRVYLDNGNNYLLYYSVWLCQVSELQPLRTQNTQLQTQNTNLQNQINDKNGYIDLLEDQVGDYEREVTRLQEDLANQESNLQTENIQLRDRVTELESSIQSLNTQVQAAQDTGYAIGYQAGFDAGNNSDNSLYNMVLAVVDAPISIFRSIFDFDILGVNISNLVFRSFIFITYSSYH